MRVDKKARGDAALRGARRARRAGGARRPATTTCCARRTTAMAGSRVSTVLVLNGPNLGRLGRRQPEIYGTTTHAELAALCVEWGRRARPRGRGAADQPRGRAARLAQRGRRRRRPRSCSTPAAWTHYSYAIFDACAQLTAPLVEVHISDPSQRPEEFRHTSVVTPHAVDGGRGPRHRRLPDGAGVIAEAAAVGGPASDGPAGSSSPVELASRGAGPPDGGGADAEQGRVVWTSSPTASVQASTSPSRGGSVARVRRTQSVPSTCGGVWRLWMPQCVSSTNRVGVAAQRAAAGVDGEVRGRCRTAMRRSLAAAVEVHRGAARRPARSRRPGPRRRRRCHRSVGCGARVEPSGERLVELTPRLRIPHPCPLHEVRLGSHLSVLRRRRPPARSVCARRPEVDHRRPRVCAPRPRGRAPSLRRRRTVRASGRGRRAVRASPAAPCGR